MSERAKQPEAEFDTYSANYDALVNSALGFSGLKVDFFTRVKAAYLTEIIGQRLDGRNETSILDIGCGVGNYHAYLSGKVGVVEGIDVSEQSIALARQNNPGIRYQVYDGYTLPYPDGSFDVAYTICVMHHVPPAQWETFASEMYRVLRPGGLALVFEHNPSNPLTQHVVSNCEFDANAVLLKASQTEGLLNGAGFSDVVSRYILTAPIPGKLGRRLDGALSRLPLGAQYYTRGGRE